MSAGVCCGGRQHRALFLPMRGYELSSLPLNAISLSRLFLPMRGYEHDIDLSFLAASRVISPHEGL